MCFAVSSCTPLADTVAIWHSVATLLIRGILVRRGWPFRLGWDSDAWLSIEAVTFTVSAVAASPDPFIDDTLERQVFRLACPRKALAALPPGSVRAAGKRQTPQPEFPQPKRLT